MSLVLKKIPTITVDVPVQLPGEDKPATIQATWTLHGWDEYRAFVDAQQKGEQKDEDLLKDLKGLSGITGEDGKDVEFSEALVAELMQVTYIRRPLILSWFAAQEGRNQAAAKN